MAWVCSYWRSGFASERGATSDRTVKRSEMRMARLCSVDPLDEFGEPFAIAVAVALAPFDEAVDVWNGRPEVQLIGGLLVWLAASAAHSPFPALEPETIRGLVHLADDRFAPDGRRSRLDVGQTLEAEGRFHARAHAAALALMLRITSITSAATR